MSVQSLAQFVHDVSADPSLERSFEAALASSADKQAAMIAFAAGAGYSFDRKELAAMVAIERGLSDEALDQVSGGFNPQPEPPGRLPAVQSPFLSFFASKGIIIIGG
jgi:predicted ribosomally synthesized peptide with nif11-like leader